MFPTKTFIRTRYEWIKLPVPTKNFTLNRSKAPSYALELKLDHLKSYVHSLGNAIIEGREYDFNKLTSGELEELNKILLGVEVCEIGEVEKEEFRKYISATQLLVQEIKNSVL